MAALIDLHIAGRVYPVACREGEEESLKAAARLLDQKCREAVAGLGPLSESRQFMFGALLLADQILEGAPVTAQQHAAPAPLPSAPPQPRTVDPAIAMRVEALALSLEALAERLEMGAQTP